jgi:hypothetical protein
LAAVFQGSTAAPESVPETIERRNTPAAAFRDPEEVFVEINRLSQDLSSLLAVLEASLRQPDWVDPDALRSAAARQDVLKTLLRVHRRLCGQSEVLAHIEVPQPGSPRPAFRVIQLPQWEGRLLQRLTGFEAGLEGLREQRSPSPLLEAAQRELNTIRDRLNRLFEMVRLFRKHFQDPEELARFNAMEAAYRGLRAEVRGEGYRVRSDTRGLDVTVGRRQRQRWAEEFAVPGRASRAVLNMRILMGEVVSTHGIPVAGSLYRTLSGGTIYDGGQRNVRVYFDADSGMIVAFQDGSDATQAAVRQHRDQGRPIAEALFSIDSAVSGRISNVTILGRVRDSVQVGLSELVGLRVLPPQVLTGFTGFAGESEARALQIHLVPDIDAPLDQWYQIAGLAPEVYPGWSLLTLEPNTPSEGQRGLQLWVPSGEVQDLAPGDPVTLSSGE